MLLHQQIQNYIFCLSREWADSFPCSPLNGIIELGVFPVAPLLGWIEIFPACMAHTAAWKTSLFLHLPHPTCPLWLFKSTKNQLKAGMAAATCRWRGPGLRVEAAFELGYSVAVSGRSDVAQLLRSAMTAVLWSCNTLVFVWQAPRVWNSLVIYYWILNSAQKMRKGLHGTLLL